MKEKYHKWIMAIFAGFIAAFGGFVMGFILALKWIVDLAINKFHLTAGININASEITNALWQYKNALGY